jgi:O-antigen ligase
MLGLGLSQYVPIVLYFTAIIIAFLSILYRVEIGLIFLVPLLPLQNVLNKIYLLGREGYPATWNFVDILITSMVIGWILQRHNKREGILEKSPLNWPIALYIIVTGLGVLKSYMFIGAEVGNIWYNCLTDWKNHIILPILCLVTFNNVRDVKWINILIIAILLSIFLNDFFFQKGFKWVKTYHYDHDMRISGTFTYLGPNELGAFFVQNIMILSGLLLFTKQKLYKILLIALTSFTFYCLMYSFSRAGYLSFLVGMLFLLFVSNKKLLLVLFILLLIAYRSILPVSVVERIDMTFLSEEQKYEKQLKDDGASAFSTDQPMFDDSAQGRMDLWRKGMELFYANPFLGCGFGTFSPIYGFDIHNNYIKYLAELGIAGFSIYLYLYYLSFKSGWRLYRNSSTGSLKGLGLGFAVCVIANMICNFTHDNWSYINLMGFYWVFFALVVRAEKIMRAETSQSFVNSKIAHI